MPDTVRELALSRFHDLLPGTPSFVTKLRNATWTIDPDSMPIVIQYDGGDDIVGDSQRVNHVDLRVQLLLGVKGATDNDLGVAMSDARGAVLSAIGADPTLGDLARWCKYTGSDDPVFSSEVGAAPAAAWALHFVIEMHEAELDPYSTV